jgi:hypothetical protein
MKTGPLESGLIQPTILDRPEEIVSVSGSLAPGGEYNYVATRRDGHYRRTLTSRRRYKWFHQWRCSTASGEPQIVHYFSSKERAAPVPAWVPGRAERLDPVSIVYL